jgi:hypothetical protein
MINFQSFNDEWVTAVLTKKIGQLQLSIEEYPGMKINASGEQMLTNILTKAYRLVENKDALPLNSDKALVKLRCKLSSLIEQV